MRHLQFAMYKSVTIGFLSIIAFLLASCDLGNQFKVKKQAEPVFRDAGLAFIVVLAERGPEELVVNFEVASIHKKYWIDTINIQLREYGAAASFPLEKINAKEGPDYKDFASFSSMPAESRAFDESTITYFLEHFYKVPKVASRRNYQVEVKAVLRTQDSIYRIDKSLEFRRHKGFKPVRWTGC